MNMRPIKVLKSSQVLLKLNSTDFSFVGEKLMSNLYEMFARINIRPNLIQSTAISILCSMDDIPEKIEKLALAASELFDVQLEKGLTLLTIRHYKPDMIEELTEGKTIILQQKTKDTIQVLMK